MASKHSPGKSAESEGLVLQGVYAQYGRVPVLRDVNISVREGESVALMGPNGVGKTTAIRTICGLLRPTAGSVAWNGQRVDTRDTHDVVKLGIGCVPEGRRLYRGMSVEENLLMGAATSSRKAASSRLSDMYSMFPLLRERRNQMAGSLSGGQQQVCAIGRALMSNPSLLLIDELSLGLSPAAIEAVVSALKRAMQQMQLTLVLVEQDITVASTLASRGYFLDMGTVVGSGPMSELMEVDYVRRLYFSGISSS